ncbi:MAG: hypothetical protein FWE37_09055, partial [Spirochaetaceae bacterium]|nr:hypothetical protein [Spirochaetaceae bacterium]
MENSEEISLKDKDTAIIFTKEIINISKIVPKNIVLKCGLYHFPVIIKELSLSKALVVVSLQYLAHEILVKNNNLVSLRFFIQNDDATVKTFFIHGVALNIENHPLSEELSELEINFNDENLQPLIELLAPIRAVIDASQKRQEERIILTAATKELLDIEENYSFVIVDGHKKRLFLRDISQLGANFIIY